MSLSPSEHNGGAVRIHLRCAGPLTPDEIRELAGQLIGGLPVAPHEVVLDPDGRGTISYRPHDGLTLDDVTAAVLWLRDHPRVADVRWNAVVDT